MSDTYYLYTGWEPHNVVRASKLVRSSLGIDTECRVLGREPITSTAMFLDGKIIEERHDRYDRGFTLEVPDGGRFKVGGTNTTSSIAAFISVVALPQALDPAPLQEWAQLDRTVDAVVEAVSVDDREGVSAHLNNLEKWLRLDLLPERLGDTIAQSIPGGRDLLESLRRERSSLLPGPAGTQEVWADCVNRLGREALSPEVCRLVALHPSDESLAILARALSSDDRGVRREASLALRSMEYQVQLLVSERPYAASLFVGEVRSALDAAPEAETRVYIAEALGYFGVDDEDVLGALTNVLTNEEDDHVRWAAAVALGRRSLVDDAIGPLVSVIQSDSFVRTRRAALLSLGRLLQRLSADPLRSETQDADWDDLLVVISAALEAPSVGERTYAAYCLGEVSTSDGRVGDLLLRHLTEESDFALRAHLLLALWKVMARGQLGEVHLDGLRRAVGIPAPEGLLEHPAASYREWFSMTALKILAFLNDHERAAQFASLCARAYRRYPARASYFQGLAEAHQAEWHIQVGETRQALRLLRGASDRFQRAAGTQTVDVPGDIGDGARTSALTRARLVEGREQFLSAVLELDRQVFSKRSLTNDYVAKLDGARSAFDSVVRSAEETQMVEPLPGRLASRAGAIETVEWQRSLALLAEQVGDLREAIAQGASRETISQSLSVLVGSITGRANQAVSTASPSVVACRDALERVVTEAVDAARVDPDCLFAEATKAVSELLYRMQESLPVPDLDHRLIGEGRARLDFLTVAGASGSGTPTDPWLLPPGQRHATLRVAVFVQIRAEDEELIVGYDDGFGVQGQASVHIHEGAEVVEFPIPDWDAGSLGLTVSLRFLFGTAQELVDERTIQLRRLAAADESPSAQEVIDRLGVNQQRIGALNDELLTLGGVDGVSDIALQKRRELADLENERREMTEQLSQAVGDSHAK